MSKTEDYSIEGHRRNISALGQFFPVQIANQSDLLTVNNWFAVWTHFETEHVNTFLDYPRETREVLNKVEFGEAPPRGPSNPYSFIPF